MRRKRIIALALAAATMLAGTGRATADGKSHHRETGRTHAVFVQTNKPRSAGGNTIRVFKRADNGRLSAAGEFKTGGNGGAVAGAPTDALASQGSLVYDGRLLFAVNAGSNTVTLFRVHGTKLKRLQVTRSGGLLPVGVAVRHGLVYVLNAGGDGAVQGFRLEHDRLHRIAGANRSLHLGNPARPSFVLSPAQVGVDPLGRFVLITTKTNNTVLAFRVGHGGRLAKRPVSTRDSNGPFAFTFDTQRTLLVVGVATNTLTRHRLDRRGSLRQIGAPVPNGQQASCWIQRVGNFYYVSNTASSTVSSYRVKNGKLRLLNGRAAAIPGGGTIDMTASGRFLYVQNATAGNVQGYAVNDDGSLRLVTTATGLPKFANGIGMEGIAAS
ncbi:lactonase family protein [Actinomadura citrea]|uniref:lactonase family protein n=1 Tax=Actinomadura citrea TaxID=46158 RepID=UPI002E2AC8BB|nr:beta-propeller fold lactonase family protein [Actinomadura citrea]